jgi:hypothetical protein
MHTSILAGADRVQLEDGRQLRLLSAMEVLQARRESEWLAREERERAVCANACLLARALERNGQPMYRDGTHVLEELTVAEIGALSDRRAQFNREVNPGVGDSEAALELKNIWSTRRGSGCTGACCDPFQPCPRRTVSDR